MLKKISWFKRLFMSWTKLEQYFASNNGKPQGVSIDTDMYNLLKEQLSIVNNNNQNLKEDIASLKSKLELQDKIIIEKKESQFEHIKQNDLLKKQLQEKEQELIKLSSEIKEKLDLLPKIEKRFFGKSGNKGIGELAELGLKNQLQKSGIPDDIWEENLIIGRTKKQVEFAIKSGEDGKYIPVDSKVITIEDDEEITESDVKKLEEPAKKISEYLGKSNTTDYGLLVLHSNSFYLKLSDNFPGEFQKIIEKYHVFIVSPTSFIQYAFTISNILDIYKKIKHSSNIYKDIQSLLNDMTTFSNRITKTYAIFSSAMEQSWPKIRRKHEKLLEVIPTNNAKLNKPLTFNLPKKNED